MAWHHNMDTPVRYRLVDVSDGGYRIRSTTPMITGMTGTALRLLPEGVALHHSLLVTWISEPFAGGEYEIGLRRL